MDETDRQFDEGRASESLPQSEQDETYKIHPAVAPTPQRLRWFLLGLFLVLAVALGLYRAFAPQEGQQQAGQQNQQKSKGGRQGAPASVGVANVGTGDIRVIVNALGTVTPLATVTVLTQISGQLVEVAYKEGQIVKKGDFLAQIDDRPYKALMAQYQGQLAHDQGLLDQARVDNVRYQTLLKQNSIARQQAEDQVYVVKQYEGSVALDQAQIDAQALNIAYCHIVSPVDGRIGLRMVDQGNYVQATSTSGLAVITQLQPISVLFPVAEDELTKILPQLKAGEKLTVTLYDRGNTTQLATGEVTTLDNQIDTTTGTVKLRAQFDNADNKLFPNQFVNARLLVKTLHDVVIVPGAAVQRGAPGAYAYVVDADNKVSVRTLKLGPSDGDMVAVREGLAAGERVVVDGADRLRDGASVTIASAQGASPAPDDPAKSGQHRHRRQNQDGTQNGGQSAAPDQNGKPAGGQ